MPNGSCPALRIVVSNSGIQGPATPRSCCRDTRTLSFQLRQVQVVNTLPPVPETCALAFGRTLAWDLSKERLYSRRVRSKKSKGVPGFGHLVSGHFVTPAPVMDDQVDFIRLVACDMLRTLGYLESLPICYLSTRAQGTWSTQTSCIKNTRLPVSGRPRVFWGLSEDQA